MRTYNCFDLVEGEEILIATDGDSWEFLEDLLKSKFGVRKPRRKDWQIQEWAEDPRYAWHKEDGIFFCPLD